MTSKQQRPVPWNLPLAPLTVTLLVLAALATLIPTSPAMAQSGFRVVVHPNNPVESLTSAEVSRFFLKKVTIWDDGSKVEPVDQSDDTAVRSAFSREIHGRGVGAIKAYWNKLIFSGRGVPPPTLRDDREVVEYVRQHPEAIGYVHPSTGTAGVKVVQVTP